FLRRCPPHLYTFKLQYPGHVTLLRGNHNCRRLTEHFKHECELCHGHCAICYLRFII
ncbi:hypothetical protein M405DRAFT_748590, partial [Rhizopogon salebrosus TDB-379]